MADFIEQSPDNPIPLERPENHPGVRPDELTTEFLIQKCSYFAIWAAQNPLEAEQAADKAIESERHTATLRTQGLGEEEIKKANLAMLREERAAAKQAKAETTESVDRAARQLIEPAAVEAIAEQPMVTQLSIGEATLALEKFRESDEPSREIIEYFTAQQQIQEVPTRHAAEDVVEIPKAEEAPLLPAEPSVITAEVPVAVIEAAPVSDELVWEESVAAVEPSLVVEAFDASHTLDPLEQIDDEFFIEPAPELPKPTPAVQEAIVALQELPAERHAELAGLLSDIVEHGENYSRLVREDVPQAERDSALENLEERVIELFKQFNIAYTDEDVENFVALLTRQDVLVMHTDRTPMQVDLEREGTHEAKSGVKPADDSEDNQWSITRLLGHLAATLVTRPRFAR